ncbi:MAG: 3-phosphoshikimate 1-carboxyvinyltransferase [Actinomycetota bacterium]
MQIIVRPGADLRGEVSVPGDKSIAHRWLILAATARGRSYLRGLPPALDVISTASSLAAVSGRARPALEVWASKAGATVEGAGSTWNEHGLAEVSDLLEVEGEGRSGLRSSTADLDCGNSGTSMRLLAGILAAAPFRSVLTGDPSLRTRPMERVAAPLRSMGATVRTDDGHAPLFIEGGALRGVRYVMPVASAQVKGAVLFAGLAAEGTTTVVEPAPVRDHTERALEALGAPILREDGVSVQAFQHDGFQGAVPGDPSSAAFLVAAAAITGSSVGIIGVGLNPTRLRFLDVMRRMGVQTEVTVEREELGEPVGSIRVQGGTDILPVRVEPQEVALVIDEIPVLAAMAIHARGDSWFLHAGELRVKESDRLFGLAAGIRAMGGEAAEEGDDLVIAGGGLTGGEATSGGDHRMAMAFAVAALGATGEVTIGGAEAADVSFPGFTQTMQAAGAPMELEP